MIASVEPAHARDVDSWLTLVAEVADLFGGDFHGFRRVLLGRIAEGSAFCVRDDGVVVGAMLCRRGSLDWLAVRKSARRRGIGRALVEHACAASPDGLQVTTFGDAHPHPDARAARQLYLGMGFRSVDQGLRGPDGTSREKLVWP